VRVLSAITLATGWQVCGVSQLRNRSKFLAAAVVTALACAASAQSATLAYDATRGGDFGVVDLGTGAFTLRGNSGVQLSGLAVGGDGALYSGHYGGSEFYRVNPLNGSLTKLGDSGIAFEDIGSTLSGVYALGVDEYLYSINIGNGAATKIGFAGFTPTVLGMSTGSADLYVAWRHPTAGALLYRVNTTNASTPLVGFTGVTFGALVTTGGVLYGGATPGNAIYTVDPSTGVSTFKANVTGTTRDFWGLAPVTAEAVPEPATWAMMLVGFSGLGAAMRRRRVCSATA
jgi:hypothetical protein